MRLVALSLVISSLCFACKSTKELEEKSFMLVPEFSGVFQKIQADKQDSNFQESCLYVERLSHGDFQNESWVYLEEYSLNGSPVARSNKILKLTESAFGILIDNFEPTKEIPKPKFSEPKSFEVLNKNIIRKLAGCTLFMKQNENGSLIGSTLGNNCQNRYKGSVFVRTELKIHQDSMWLLEQGFDEYNRLIWGPRKSINKYQRLQLVE